jgi:peptidoglycan/LPS O-acetylase OafA/YrhL
MTHTLAQKILYRLIPSAQFEASDLMTKLGVVFGYMGLVVICTLATYYLVENPCRGVFKKLVRRPTEVPKELIAR